MAKLALKMVGSHTPPTFEAPLEVKALLSTLEYLRQPLEFSASCKPSIVVATVYCFLLNNFMAKLAQRNASNEDLLSVASHIPHVQSIGFVVSS